MRKLLVISSFFLKIAAILFMVFDHVGMLLEAIYFDNYEILKVASAFRSIGRIALPLFILMIVEGVIHTKSIKKYFIRLGIIASIISLALIVFEYTPLKQSASFFLRAGNIFLDLILTALTVYIFTLKDKRKWLLTLLPLGFSILSFIVKCLEISKGIDIHWFPAFLTLQYDWVSIVLGAGFYFAYKLADSYIAIQEQNSGIDKSVWEANGNYRVLVNIISAFIMSVVIVFEYMFVYIWPAGVFWDASIQLYALISGAFILLYNGKRGYNAKWFQYGSYIFYPLHLLIIIGIFLIINGGL